jgi:hypothetical protein
MAYRISVESFFISGKNTTEDLSNLKTSIGLNGPREGKNQGDQEGMEESKKEEEKQGSRHNRPEHGDGDQDGIPDYHSKGGNGLGTIAQTRTEGLYQSGMGQDLVRYPGEDDYIRLHHVRPLT